MHIVGCERSGTTLLLEMMTAGFAFDARCEREQSIFDPAPAESNTFLSKKPLDVLRIETVLRHDPELFVLCTLRDPRAVITSRHAGRPDRYLSDFDTWQACLEAARRLGRHDRFVLVRYERLVADPDGVQAEIAKRLPFLERTGSFARFHETAAPTRTGELALGGVRPLDAAASERWRADLGRVKAEWLRRPDLAEVLVEEGYEPDASWLEVLGSVQAAAGPRRSRTPAWLRSLERAIRYGWKTRRYLARRARQRARH